MAILSNLKPPRGAVKDRTRLGRGVGSKGKTCGKGQKGQNCRSGIGGRLHFEGGQMPLQRRLPKRGFRNIHADRVVNVNVASLNRFDSGSEVTIEALRAERIVKGRFDRVKILGEGELSKELTVHAHCFSAGAAEKIERAGGKVVVVESSAKPSDTTGSE